MDGAGRHAKTIYLALSISNSKPCPMLTLRYAVVVPSSSSKPITTTHYYYEIVLGDREGYRLPLVHCP